MGKKAKIVLGALATVIALMMPAVANATELTEGGTLVPVGSRLTAFSTDFEWESPLGTFTCETFDAGGTVTQNGGGVVQGVGNGESSTANCVIDPEKLPITLEEVQLIGVNMSSPASGNISLSFKVMVPGLPNGCVYSGTTPATYSSGSDTLVVNGGGLEGTPSICGEQGELVLRAHFTLTTAGTSTPVILS
jgi:hypothetical protein